MSNNIPKKLKISLAAKFIHLLVIFAILVMSAVTTVAWFSQSKQTGNSGMQIIVSTTKYELLIDRTQEFDRMGEYPNPIEPIYPGVSELKTILNSLNYNTTFTSTEDSPLLAYELINESDVDDDYSIRPGAYGTLTFYLKPLVAGNLNLTFDLTLTGYTNTYDAYDNLVIEPVTNETAHNYLKGHILFFTGRTGLIYSSYKYTGLITDSFTYNTSEHSPIVSGDEKNGCYEITLYWEWIYLYSDLNDNISTTSPVTTKKYPAEVRTYINQNKNYFFAKNRNSEDLSELDDGYNDADQIIGDYFKYITVLIEAN